MSTKSAIDARLGRPASIGLNGDRIAAIALFAIATVTLQGLPLLHLAANRLVVGNPLHADAVFGRLDAPIVALLALGCAFIAAGRRRWSSLAAQVCLASALVLVGIALGSAADGLTEGRPGATRVRLASGAVLGCVAIALALAWSMRSWPARERRLAAIGLATIGFGFAWSGLCDRLSIAIEFHARRQELVAAVTEHIALSSAALLLAAVLVGGLYAVPRLRGAIEQIVAGLQVVPAVALFGGLVVAISATLDAAPALRNLGVGALGSAPAIIGVAAYLLLPLWRGLRAALDTVDASTVEAAEAIGLSRHQVLTRVRLPLGATVLIGALRVATVQSIGLTTLGALVGAGGLGRIVFDGMAQFATDLIVLGAVPILAWSYAADSALAAIEDTVGRD